MSRRRPGWVPNQHGAWAMLAAPLLVGAVEGWRLGGQPWRAIPLGAFWFLGYFLYFAACLWLTSRRQVRYLRPMVVYGVLAAVAGVVVAVMDIGLLPWCAAFVAPLTTGLVCAAQRKSRSVRSGAATVVAASLMCPVTEQMVAGRVDAAIWVPTAVLAAYFFGTVLYVKSVIRERGNRRYHAYSVGYHAAVTAVSIVLSMTGFVSVWLPALWVALTGRAWIMAGRRVRPAIVGAGEVVATIALIGVLVS